MDEQKNNVRIIFTAKANSALDAIVKNYGLEESAEEFLKKTKAGRFSNEVVIDHLAKDFAMQRISEADMATTLQKETAVSLQTAEKILKEIITNIVPFLEKVPEEKLQDYVFVEELERKIFGTANELIKKTETEKNTDFFPKIKPAMSTDKPIENIPQSPKKQERIKQPIRQEKNEKLAPRIKQSKGQDNYREPIE